MRKYPALQCGDRQLDLSQPVLMGVVNVTPDSFSDGGSFNEPAAAAAHAVALAEAGAAIIDIGGESTRPGAVPVSEGEELRRVLPVIESLRGSLDAVISVDTSKPAVMAAAAAAGVGLINDIRALSAPGALQAAAETGLPVCLMHMQGNPASMQDAPRYNHPVDEVRNFFAERLRACERAGIAEDRLLLDPGFGFGKTLEHNLTLLARLDRFLCFGRPIVVGVSRKSMFHALLGRNLKERLAASLAAGLLAIQQGAVVLRVHDVAPHADALAVLRAVTDRAGADALTRRNGS